MPTASSIAWIALLVTLASTSVAAFTGGTDPTMPVKLLVFAVVGTGGLGVAVGRQVIDGKPALGPPRVWGPFAAFLAAVLLATILSPTPWYSLVGTIARFDGLLVYGTLGLLALLALPAANDDWARRFLWVAVGTVAAQVVLGLLELGGLLPDLGAGVSGVKGTLGNPNFYGGFVGSLAGPVLWLVLDQDESLTWRVPAAVLYVGVLAVTVLSNAAQGPVAAAISSGVVLFAWLLNLPTGAVRRGTLGLYSVVAATGLGTVAAGFQGVGPLSSIADPSSFLLRTYWWRTAIAIGADSPVVGRGLDTYELYFRVHRPPVAAVGTSVTTNENAAHNVFLQLFAGGGVLLLVSYAAILIATLFASWRLMRHTSGSERLRVGAVASVWAGYVVQSSVSIDVLPLPVLGWTAAALVIGLANRAEWLPAEQLSSGRRGRKGKAQVRTPTGLSWLISRPPLRLLMSIVVLLMVALPAAMIGSRPVRADRAVYLAQQAEAAQDLDASAALFSRAAQLAFWDPDLMNEAGQIHLLRNDREKAVAALRESENRAGGGYFPATITLFRIFSAEGNTALADEFFVKALALDPLSPAWLEEAIIYADERGMSELSSELTRRLADVRAAA